MDTWDSLPDDLKKATDDAAKDYFDALNDIYMEEMEKVDELVKQGKVKLSFWMRPVLKEHAEVAYECGTRSPKGIRRC